MKSVAGVKVTTPSALMAMVPLGTLKLCAMPGVIVMPLIDLTLSVVLSTSVSLPARLRTSGTSSLVFRSSSTATGASFAPLMVMVSEAVATSPSASVIA